MSSEPRVTITREISRSAITTVAEGYDSGLDRKVLVKSIHPQFARESDLRARLEREARAIARISHPNVVQIYDLRTEGDELALILEFVEGSSLGKLIKERSPFPAEVALTITLRILAGLEVAHASGIIHRDLKPDNVLVSSHGEVKITDFGLATLSDQPSVTLEGMVIGTPSYMAPEQASGGTVTASTDLFATGLMLFEMLTGVRAIPGATLNEAYQAALRFQLPRLEEYAERIPESVVPVLRRLLDRTPEKRPVSSAEAASMLAETVPEGPLSPALLSNFFAGGAIQRASVARVALAPPWATRRRDFMLLALVLVIVGVVGYYVAVRTFLGGSAVDSVFTADSLTLRVNSDSILADSQTVSGISDTSGQGAKVVPQPVDTSRERPARQDTMRHPAEPEGPGMLAISTRPWARVFLGDSLLGSTPFSAGFSLPSGEYSLTFLNAEIGYPVVRRVAILPGIADTLELDLYEFVARMKVASVKPWADVFVDDTFVLRTPSSQVIFRPLGTHRISLKHPDFQAFTDTVTFGHGDPVYEIRHDFTQL